MPCPDLPILAFFLFSLFFFVLQFSLCVFALLIFPRILRARQIRKSLLFFGGSLLFFLARKARIGGSGYGNEKSKRTNNLARYSAEHPHFWTTTIPCMCPVCPVEMSRLSRGHSVQSMRNCTDVRMSRDSPPNSPRHTS